MTCAKCKRELVKGEKITWGMVGEETSSHMVYCFCEPCWKELMKGRPVNPAYTTPPHIPEKLK